MLATKVKMRAWVASVGLVVLLVGCSQGPQRPTTEPAQERASPQAALAFSRVLAAFTSSPVHFSYEPTGDVPDGILHVDVVGVDRSARTITIDATQMYVGNDIGPVARRLHQPLSGNGFELEYNQFSHRQTVSVDASAVFVMQIDGSERTRGAAPAVGSLYATDFNGFASGFRQPGADYWVVLDSDKLVCLVERFSS